VSRPFLALLALFPALARAAPTLAVDAAADRHPISDDIYGMNFADESLAQDVHLSVDRWGGNATSRYNWQVNVGNAGADYYFIVQNLSSSTTPGADADAFVDQDRRTGTRSILTIPLIPWIAKGRSPVCSYSVPPFTAGQFAPHNGFGPTISYGGSTCGNGWSGSAWVAVPNAQLTAVNVANTTANASSWIAHLVGKYGSAAAGGVRFYMMDNEPSLWESTHQDVYARGALSYAALRDLTYPYARAVKDADSAAQVMGPSDWGYMAYFDAPSALDGNGGGYAANGNVFFGEWYLQQMKAYEQANGVRILDYFDEHYYPQATGTNGAQIALHDDDGDPATQALRLRSVRSLWDPTYTDESWIPSVGPPYPAQVELIPRFRQWVANDYPGTKVSISEYNFGALNSINGALTQADVLGVFGREQVDLATLWGPPSSSQPGAFAFRIYRNYDGAGSRYGDTWVRSTSGDQGQLSIYAALRSSDGALTVVVINKTTGALTTPLSLANFTAGAAAQRFQYSAANLAGIEALADVPVSGSSISATYPASSITLFVIAGTGTTPPDGGAPDAGGADAGGSSPDGGSGDGGGGGGGGPSSAVPGVSGSCSASGGGPALAGLLGVLVLLWTRRR
jgi:uncharacterized protein (TIGR03382 family)